MQACMGMIDKMRLPANAARSLVQRPEFKDFFLTKSPTADSKSHVLPPAFFSPMGGIGSRLKQINNRSMVSIGNESGVFKQGSYGPKPIRELVLGELSTNSVMVS